MACSNYVCPGNFTVFISTKAADLGEAVDSPSNIDGTAFDRIPEVLSWELTSSVDEPDAFRTADTGGSRVTPCGGAVTWEVTVTTKICIGDWLYDYLLDPDEMADGWYQGSETLDRAWFYLSFDGNQPSALASATDKGIFLIGRVTPPGFGGDNNTDEAAEAEFTIQLIMGPFIPNL